MNFLTVLLLLPLAWFDEKYKWAILLIALLYINIHVERAYRRYILLFLVLCTSYANWFSYAFVIKDSIAFLYLLFLLDGSVISKMKPLKMGHLRTILFVNLIYVFIGFLCELEFEFNALIAALFSLYLFSKTQKIYYIFFYVLLFLVVTRTQQLFLIASVFYLYRLNIYQLLLGLFVMPIAAIVVGFFRINGRDYSIDIVELLIFNRWAPFFLEYPNMTLSNKIFGKGLGSSFYIPWFEYGAYGHQNLYSPNIDSLFLTVYYKLGVFGFILMILLLYRNHKERWLILIAGIGGSLIYQLLILVLLVFKLIVDKDEKKPIIIDR